MAAKAPRTQTAKKRAAAPEDVESFLAALEHPFKPEILALRKLILEAHPSISEGIKWNAPSFRTSEFFATFHLRAKDGVQVILHRGAKKRELPASGLALSDPGALLEWLDKDRASVKFRDVKEIEARGPAFADVIRQWLAFV